MYSMTKITTEVLDKMVTMRESGATYKVIEDTLNVSEWACLKYLKGIGGEKSAIEKEWRTAEIDAIEYLKTRGFTELHDLNKISPTAYWDILAKRSNENWLIDVMIGEGKRVGSKIPHFVDGYVHSILHRNVLTNEWKLIKLQYEEVS